jgi:hypothetical protein
MQLIGGTPWFPLTPSCPSGMKNSLPFFITILIDEKFT